MNKAHEYLSTNESEVLKLIESALKLAKVEYEINLFLGRIEISIMRGIQVKEDDERQLQ